MDVNARLSTIKKDLRLFEKAFEKENGRPPSKADIDRDLDVGM
jgi:hypothetical protein